MKHSEIVQHLDLEANKFLALFDEPFKKRLLGKFYFAGGCIYSLANDKTPKDYDIFLIDDSLIFDLKALSFWQYTTDYALSCGKFQVVIKYFGEQNECVGQFDFRHNMHWYMPFGGKVQSVNEYDFKTDFDDWEYIHTNELIFNENRARDVEGVFLRIDKFVKRGMTISKETKKAIKKRTTKKAIKTYEKKRSGGSRKSCGYY